MKTILRITTLLFLTDFSFGQSFQRLDKETPEKFVIRVTQVENIVYPIILTKEWDTTKTIIIAFIPTPDEITVGLMFVPTNGLTYRQVLIDSFSTLGNTARIGNVFFANADNDKTKELIVMTSYDQSHGNETGKVYWNLIFDNPNLLSLPVELQRLQNVYKKIDGSYEGILNGQMKYSKFKKASDVKSELINLGY